MASTHATNNKNATTTWFLGSMFVLLGIVALAAILKKKREGFEETKLPYETGVYDGSLGVGENSYVADRTTVSGMTRLHDTIVKRNMTVSNNNTTKENVFTMDVIANADVDVANTLGIGGNWTVGDTLNSKGAISTGYLEVGGNANIKGHMTVSSGLNLNNSLDTNRLVANSTLGVGDANNGNTNGNGNLNVMSYITADSDMIINGDAGIGGDLTVKSSTNLGNNSIFKGSDTNLVSTGIEANSLTTGEGRVLFRNSVEAKKGVSVGGTASLMNGVLIGTNTSGASLGVNEDGTNIITGVDTVVNGDYVCLNKHCLESKHINNARTLRDRIVPKMNAVKLLIRKQLNAITKQHNTNTRVFGRHTNTYDAHTKKLTNKSSKTDTTLQGLWNVVQQGEADMIYIGSYNVNQDARITNLEESVKELDGKFWDTVNNENLTHASSPNISIRVRPYSDGEKD